ncbi:MAG: C2 family cysteine protease [Bacteroidia bacterium]|nr:C2 family cysteine protease [Bacteroidia bacterium]
MYAPQQIRQQARRSGARPEQQGGIALAAPPFALTAAHTQPIQREEAPASRTRAGYPEGYEMSEDQFLAEHQLGINLLYNALSSSELVAEARRLQAALSAGAEHSYLQFEQARSLALIRDMLLRRASNYSLFNRTDTIFGGTADDIDTAIGDVNDPLWGLEMNLPEPFGHYDEWLRIIEEGAEFRAPEDAAATAAANPRLSGRVRGGASGPAAREYRMAPYIAQLFSRGAGDEHAIDPNDVVQGQLSDCYFMASIAAVAQTHPEALGRLIRDNGDGTYDVTLYVSGDRLNPSQPRTVTVRPDVPVSGDGGQAYARITSASEPELWVQLLEKAYASLRGGYGALDTGGDAGTGLFALTGSRGTYYANPSLTQSAIRERLQEALDSGWPVVAGTPSGSHPLRVSYGILNWHMYHFTGFNLDGHIELENPWGSRHLTGEDAVPVNVFKSTFHGFTVLRDYTGD